MSVHRRILPAVLGLLLAGCAGTAERAAWDRWEETVPPAARADEPAPASDGAPSAARAVPSPGPGSGLGEVLAYADAHNPELRALRAEWEAVLEGIPAARALPDPRLGYAYMVEPVETRVGPQRQRVSVQQGLPWFGTTGLRGEMEADRAQAAAARYASERLRVRAEVRRVWAEMHYLSRAREVTAVSRDLLVNIEATAQQRYAAGSGSQAPVLRAQLELGRLEDDLASLADRRVALAAELNAVLGRDSGAPLPDPGALEPPPLPGEPQLREALLGHPSLEAYEHLASREERAERLAARRGLPDLTLGAEWIDIGEARFEGVPDSGKDAFAVSASVNLPLWRGSYDAERDRARARGRAVHNRAEARRRALESDLEQALFAVRDARRRRELYADVLLPKAEQSVAVLQRGFSSGSASFLDVVDAQRTLLEFELQLARAETDAFAGTARVLRLTALDSPEVPR